MVSGKILKSGHLDQCMDESEKCLTFDQEKMSPTYLKCLIPQEKGKGTKSHHWAQEGLTNHSEMTQGQGWENGDWLRRKRERR